MPKQKVYALGIDLGGTKTLAAVVDITTGEVIASERNKLFPYRMVKRSYDRLGGPKELVTLSGKGMWGLNREFNEEYCAHVIRWFNAQS